MDDDDGGDYEDGDEYNDDGFIKTITIIRPSLNSISEEEHGMQRLLPNNRQQVTFLEPLPCLGNLLAIWPRGAFHCFSQGNDDLIQQGQVQGRRQGDERYPEDRQQGGRYQEDRHGEDADDDDDLEDVPVTEDNLQVLTS